MKNFLSKLKIPFGGIILLLVVVALGVINHKSGTILTGWDNLHPEFALDVNIKRSLFAVWQEYQGLGLLGGMGHASDLVRQIILLLLSTVIPMELLRYIATLGTLLIGSLGAYFLIRNVLLPYENGRKEITSTIGGLFYLLNIATIQTYFVAFEAFTSHYAALPWLLFGALSYIRNNNRKYFLIFILITLLATPAGYIPTLFVAFLIALTILFGGILTFNGNRIQFLLKALKTYLLIFTVNAFWLLPFLYFTVTTASVNVNAKMNQMATETIYLQNKEYGNISDVMQLKGFWFSNVDPDMNGAFQFMLKPWIQHFNQPIVTIAAYALFAIVLLGAFYILKHKRPLHIAFLILFLFSFTMLATNTIPFSWFDSLFRLLPLFGQAFRFPFTKFAILTTLTYSILFAFGVTFITELVKRYLKQFAYALVIGVAIILIGITSYPAFTGNLFYQKEQLKLPDEYYKTFEFFKNQDQNTRIANFPQHTFWGWNFYNWGYGGSGFLWYGIKQPILDRAFDVWSNELENYYYEISSAIYKKDPSQVVQILNKYQIKWLLVDRNVYSPFSPKAVYLDETEEILSKIPTVKKVKQFGNITIYEVQLHIEPKAYTFTTPLLPKVNSYSWDNDDTAYNSLGNYQTTNNSTDISYPFRSLFTYRTDKEKEFAYSSTNSSLIFKQKIQTNGGQTLTIPNFMDEEKIIPVEYFKEVKDGQIYISLQLLTPEVSIGGITVTPQRTSIPIFQAPIDAHGEYTINSNGLKNYKVIIEQPFFQRTYLSLTQDNIITLKNETTGEIQTNSIPSDYLKSALTSTQKAIKLTKKDKGKELVVSFAKVIDGSFGYSFNASQFASISDCNPYRKGTTKAVIDPKNPQKGLTLTSINDTLCTSVIASTLPHSESYMTTITAKSTAGRGLHFWAQNLDQNYAPVDTYVNEKTTTSTIILAPMEDFGQGYSFHMENVSIGSDAVTNTITSLEVTPISYRFLKAITITDNYQLKPKVTINYDVTHPQESLYRIENIKSDSNPFTFVLSQSYDKGWNAYVVDPNTSSFLAPFLGRHLTTHIEVNNWENGWEIDPKLITHNSELVIVYLPQYLEYLGFGLGIIPFLIAVYLYLQGLFPYYKKMDNYFENLTNQLRLRMGK